MDDQAHSSSAAAGRFTIHIANCPFAINLDTRDILPTSGSGFLSYTTEIYGGLGTPIGVTHDDQIHCLDLGVAPTN